MKDEAGYTISLSPTNGEHVMPLFLFLSSYSKFIIRYTYGFSYEGIKITRLSFTFMRIFVNLRVEWATGVLWISCFCHSTRTYVTCKSRSVIEI